MDVTNNCRVAHLAWGEVIQLEGRIQNLLHNLLAPAPSSIILSQCVVTALYFNSIYISLPSLDIFDSLKHSFHILFCYYDRAYRLEKVENCPFPYLLCLIALADCIKYTNTTVYTVQNRSICSCLPYYCQPQLSHVSDVVVVVQRRWDGSEPKRLSESFSLISCSFATTNQ